MDVHEKISQHHHSYSVVAEPESLVALNHLADVLGAPDRLVLDIAKLVIIPVVIFATPGAPTIEVFVHLVTRLVA